MKFKKPHWLQFRVNKPEAEALEDLENSENSQVDDYKTEQKEKLKKIKKLLSTLDRTDAVPCPKCKNKDYVVQISYGFRQGKNDEEFIKWREVGLLPGGYYSRGCTVIPTGSWICEKCSTEYNDNGQKVYFSGEFDDEFDEIL